MRRSITDVPAERAFSVLLLAAVFLTNRYLSLESDAAWVRFAGGDSYSYLAMAKAFPSLPHDMFMDLHHAQRVFFPYVLGGVAWLLGVPADPVFRTFAVLVVLGVVFVFHGILDHLGLEPGKQMILLSFLILNTYMFRFHLAIPWMISDLGFQLGLAVLLLGLVRERVGLTFAGLLAATLAKQTALLLIPGVMAWIWWEWKARPRRVRAVQCLGVAVLGLTVYQATTWLVRAFSGPSVVTRHVRGLFRWMARAFSLAELSSFLAKGVIGFVFPAALFLSLAVGRRLPRGWYRNRRLQLCLVLTGSVCLQPLVAGPAITGHSITRLAMLGYLPLLVGLASILAETSLPSALLRRLVFLSAFSVTLGSFHHFYSFLGELDGGRGGRFVAVYLASSLLLFIGSLALQHVENSSRA